MSRWTLERTLELLARVSGPTADVNASRYPDAIEAVRRRLASCLAAAPLPRPADHAGPIELDMFEVCLNRREHETLLACIDAARAGGRITELLGGRRPAGFVAAWHEQVPSD